MTDLHYENPRLVSIYDSGNGWSDDRDFYLSLGGDRQARILDLGCGTGLLCNAYAERGHLVTGVDPSASMLDAAKRTPWGAKIEWVQSGAQSFHLDKKFDLIVMTGHAFQVLLTDKDVASACAVIRNHLDEDGIFAFETRNPTVDWAAKWDGMSWELQSPEGVVRESFKVLSTQGERIIFQTEYAFTDERLISVSELRFMSLEAITAHLNKSGLCVHRLLGEWDGRPFIEHQSQEMIFLVRRA
jgi:SAM-dependent methyltransferase